MQVAQKKEVMIEAPDKPGIYKISNALYHAGPGLSSSALKHLAVSGAHYKAAVEAPSSESGAMRLGTLVHCMLLEPESILENIYVGEFNRRYGKEYEKALEQCGPDRVLVSVEDLEQAKAITAAFKKQAADHPCFNGTQFNLLEGQKELAFYAEDPRTGILLKAKPDNLTYNGVCVDIKTTRNASADSFQRDAVNFGYHLSAAFYLHVISLALKAGFGSELKIQVPTHFVIIAIENEAPYAFQTYFFSTQALLAGQYLVDRALDTYAECISTSQWTAYPKKMIELDLPKWAYYKLDGGIE